MLKIVESLVWYWESASFSIACSYHFILLFFPEFTIKIILFRGSVSLIHSKLCQFITFIYIIQAAVRLEALLGFDRSVFYPYILPQVCLTSLPHMILKFLPFSVGTNRIGYLTRHSELLAFYESDKIMIVWSYPLCITLLTIGILYKQLETQELF